VARGARVVGPGSGALACGYEGPGRLAEPDEIVEVVLRTLAPQDLAGEQVLVSAGPTQEPLDPVRYLSNHSSGKMGYALARVARRRGAEVTLVTGPTALAAPPGVATVQVTTARAMARAMDDSFARATIVVMAAAVADHRPAVALDRKMKKGAAGISLALQKNPDIVRGLGARKGRRLLVGFAAETHDLAGEARRKLRAKRLDLIVANDVTVPGAGFGADRNTVLLLDAGGHEESLPLLPKEEIAERILDWVAARRTLRRRPGSGRATRRRSPPRSGRDA
jgi:phosphopantothenoylcysteine decarboxylase/phosphopantothenate--cysteine ligase